MFVRKLDLFIIVDYNDDKSENNVYNIGKSTLQKF